MRRTDVSASVLGTTQRQFSRSILTGPGRVCADICLAAALMMAWSATTALAVESKSDKPTREQLIEQERVKAKAFRDALASEVHDGNVDALLDLATLMEQGDAFAPADRPAAFDLFEKAADKHDRFGRERMCIAYLLGEGRPMDVAKASTYCDPLGVDDPVGMFWAAYAFEHAVGGPADEKSAIDIYSAAVDIGSGDSADALGRIAIQKKAQVAARHWFRRGTFLGSADAMDHLASMTEAGDGGEADTTEAGWLYWQAASRGNVHAQAWVKDRAGFPLIPMISLMSKSGTKTTFTHSYTAKGKPAQEDMDITRIVKILTDNYQGVNDSHVEMAIEGNATIECYIDSHHEIDACVIREFPMAYGFGPTLEAFFSGRVAVSEQDGDGVPTARKRVALTVRWVLDGGH